MSDYYSEADLRGWLAEEVFAVRDAEITSDILALFERWRERIESDIRGWMASDDGDGRYSWRSWGRGFNAIPDDEMDAFYTSERNAWGILRARGLKPYYERLSQ